MLQIDASLHLWFGQSETQLHIPVDNIKSVFEKQPDLKQINITLAVFASRKIDNGSCIKYNKGYYLPVDTNGHPVNYHKGIPGVVIKAFNILKNNRISLIKRIVI